MHVYVLFLPKLIGSQGGREGGREGKEGGEERGEERGEEGGRKEGGERGRWDKIPPVLEGINTESKNKEGAERADVGTNTCYSKRSLWICKHLLIMDDSHGLHFLSPILPQLVCEHPYNFQLYTFVLAQIQRIRIHLEYMHTQRTREKKKGLYTASSWQIISSHTDVPSRFLEEEI